MTIRSVEVGFTISLNQIDNSLCLEKIKLSIEKGSASKFSGAGGDSPFGQRRLTA